METSAKLPELPKELQSCSPEPELPPPGSELMRNSDDQAAWGIWITSIGFAYRDCHFKFGKLVEWYAATQALIDAAPPTSVSDKK